MSLTVSRLVWAARLPVIQKTVLLRLADRADDSGGKIFPAVATTAEDCGMSERAARDALRYLEQIQILVCTGSRKGGRGRATEYRIDLQRLVDHPRVRAADDKAGVSCRVEMKNTAACADFDAEKAAPHAEFITKNAAPHAGSDDKAGTSCRFDTEKAAPHAEFITKNAAPHAGSDDKAGTSCRLDAEKAAPHAEKAASGAPQSTRNLTIKESPDGDSSDAHRAASVSRGEEISEAVNLYNEMAAALDLPVAQKISDARRRKLAARLRDCGGIEGWMIALEKLAESPFLTGGTDRGFRADLDFLCQEKSFTRLMEGFYADRRTAPQPGRPTSPGRQTTADAMDHLARMHAAALARESA